MSIWKSPGGSSLNRRMNQKPANTYATYTPTGDKVTNRATLTKNDGTPIDAYLVSPGTGTGNAVAKASSGSALSANDRNSIVQMLLKAGYSVPSGISDEELLSIYAQYQGSVLSQGTASTSQLKGGGSIITPQGTKSKNTTSMSTGNSNVRNNGNGTYSVRGKPGWYTAANFS